MATLDSTRVRIDFRYRNNGLSHQLLGRNAIGTADTFPVVPGAWVWSDATEEDGIPHHWSDDSPATFTDDLGEGEGGGSGALSILFDDGNPLQHEDGDEIEWDNA